MNDTKPISKAEQKRQDEQFAVETLKQVLGDCKEVSYFTQHPNWVLVLAVEGGSIRNITHDVSEACGIRMTDKRYLSLGGYGYSRSQHVHAAIERVTNMKLKRHDL